MSGGPAMIEAGGLGVFKVRQHSVADAASKLTCLVLSRTRLVPSKRIFPTVACKLWLRAAVHALSKALQRHSDILVPTEREATVVAKALLSFFQGALPTWKHTSDQRLLRHILPASRSRAYDVRDAIRTIADDDSFLEIGAAWGQSLVTGFARVEGQPLGVLASSTLSPLGGAIDAASARKAIRFVEMLKRTQAAHLLVLCDTPGFMVSPAAELEGGIRIFPELFASMADFTDLGGRLFAVTLRKAYGMGVQALLGGSTLSNHLSASWPEGEFAAMSIEGELSRPITRSFATTLTLITHYRCRHASNAQGTRCHRRSRRTPGGLEEHGGPDAGAQSGDQRSCNGRYRCSH